jgi:hypothetical protein
MDFGVGGVGCVPLQLRRPQFSSHTIESGSKAKPGNRGLALMGFGVGGVGVGCVPLPLGRPQFSSRTIESGTNCRGDRRPVSVVFEEAWAGAFPLALIVGVGCDPLPAGAFPLSLIVGVGCDPLPLGRESVEAVGCPHAIRLISSSELSRSLSEITAARRLVLGFWMAPLLPEGVQLIIMPPSPWTVLQSKSKTEGATSPAVGAASSAVGAASSTDGASLAVGAASSAVGETAPVFIRW